MMKTHRIQSPPGLCLILACLLSSAVISCRKEKEIEVYQVARETPAGASQTADHEAAAAAPHGDTDGRVTWMTPEGWAAVPAGTVRYATRVVGGADGARAELAVTRFPGDVGGDHANVNRWRAQIGLPPVAVEDLDSLMTRVAAGPVTLSLVDFTKDDTRVATAWTRHGDDTWFFKFSGPVEIVGAEMAGFTALLESIRFHTQE